MNLKERVGEDGTMKKKITSVRCSLDDFIEKNKYTVRVAPSSDAVELGTGYHVLPGLLFDLLALKGKEYQLEAPSVVEGTDISKSVGFAYILDECGNKTGYHLSSYCGQNPDGTGKYFGYFIEEDSFIESSLAERLKKTLRGFKISRELPLPYVA